MATREGLACNPWIQNSCNDPELVCTDLGFGGTGTHCRKIEDTPVVAVPPPYPAAGLRSGYHSGKILERKGDAEILNKILKEEEGWKFENYMHTSAKKKYISPWNEELGEGYDFPALYLNYTDIKKNLKHKLDIMEMLAEGGENEIAYLRSGSDSLLRFGTQEKARKIIEEIYKDNDRVKLYGLPPRSRGGRRKRKTRRLKKKAKKAKKTNRKIKKKKRRSRTRTRKRSKGRRKR